MEVCEQNEAFAEAYRDLVFSHTKIILREGDQYYYAITSRCYFATSEVDLLELDFVSIPASQIWPLFSRQFTRALELLLRDCYVKRLSLLYYGDTEAFTELSSLLLNEAGVCEILRAFLYFNIAQYFGCMVENDRITGFCFVKYGVNLLERVTKDFRFFDIDFFLRGIQKGIQHFYSLDLIHCDFNPTNILMDKDTPAGTRGWTSEAFKFASLKNDEYGLSKIRDFLFQVKDAEKLLRFPI
ncbi:serine/threonine-protein kinase-like protein [Bisporella sp. PMI_857]|nr:serine/threonine-protein kinase-like protein [Bisporella sp. PMI_857]